MQKRESTVEKSPPEQAPKRRPGEAGESFAPQSPGVVSELLHLQRSYGNRYVQRVVAPARQTRTPANRIQRLVKETDKTRQLKKLLEDDKENAAIELMATLSPDEKKDVLESREFKELAISAFNNDEMYRAVLAMQGDLYFSLQWLFDEGTDWKKVKDVIPKAPSGHERVRGDTWMRDQFVSLLNNKEMAEAVQLLGGPLLQKLQWMLAEGTDGDLVYEAIRRTPDAELADVRNNKEDVLTGLQKELSSSEYKRVQQMLNGGLLAWEDVSKRVKEQHYEQESATSPWELKTFRWTSAYEIRYTRTELALVVRIKLTGEPTTPVQRTAWVNGIKNRWDNKFHLENDNRLAFTVDPVFTSDDAHHKVEVHAACTRADMTNWCTTSTPDTAAHEFGHMVGLEDEYRLSAADYTRLTGKAPPAAGAAPPGYTEPGLMGDKSSGPEGRHLAPFVQWLNAHRRAGEKPYRLAPGPP